MLLPVFEVIKGAKTRGIKYDVSSLPKNLQELLNLAFAVDRKPSHGSSESESFLEKIGEKTIKTLKKIADVNSFLLDICSAIGKFFVGKSVMRGTDFFAAQEECGRVDFGFCRGGAT